MKSKKIPKKYQPKGYEILHEDLDLFVGNKSAGFLTVATMWDKTNTIHAALNQFVRKGDPRSRKCVYVVHRLDQGTTGVLIFAKSEAAQNFLKDNWKTTTKTYYAIVHGKMAKKSATLESYLTQDEDYVMHSSAEQKGEAKLAQTEYKVLAEADRYSLLEINLLTGRKNQIRVHMADAGNPVVGDSKYGKPDSKIKDLALHAAAIEFTHPHSRKRMRFVARVPAYFSRLVPYSYMTS